MLIINFEDKPLDRLAANRAFVGEAVGASAVELDVLIISTAPGEGDNGSVTTASELPYIGGSLSISPSKPLNNGKYVKMAEEGVNRISFAYQEQQNALAIKVAALYLQYREALDKLQLH